MLTRIVVMNFQKDKVPDFLELFSRVNGKIRSLPGCKHLELKRNIKDRSQLATISKWDSEADLNNYRNSEFFKDTWKKTKALFISDAEAFSFEDVGL